MNPTLNSSPLDVALRFQQLFTNFLTQFGSGFFSECQHQNLRRFQFPFGDQADVQILNRVRLTSPGRCIHDCVARSDRSFRKAALGALIHAPPFGVGIAGVPTPPRVGSRGLTSRPLKNGAIRRLKMEMESSGARALRMRKNCGGE